MSSHGSSQCPRVQSYPPPNYKNLHQTQYYAQVPHKTAPIDLHPSNHISFRKDVHTLWDSSAIVFVPKPDSSDKDRSRLVCHVINPPGKSVDSDMEIHSLYHYIPILPIPHPVEFLFARFGWSLFTNTIIVLFADDDGKSDPDMGGFGLSDVDVSDLVYSVRTGQMECFDNGAESGDCPLGSSHSSRDPFSDLSDDSEPPRKKSRPSSVSEDIAEDPRSSRSRSRFKRTRLY
ncbi:hypothetical protein K445DRAFT_313157 [Daldinia sp. EC12]|nr:hypothetical protein K445DRAFT_313157 [Daldinia sp. EC12]